MENKYVVAGLTAAVTLVVTMIIVFVVTTFGEGQDAVQKALIENVIKDELKLPDGRTLGQVIITNETKLLVMAGQMEILIAD